MPDGPPPTTAQTEDPRAEIDVTGVVAPSGVSAPTRTFAGTGEGLVDVVPTPSWPLALEPQHLTVELSLAHANASPAVMSFTPLSAVVPVLAIRSGTVELALVVGLIPSCPDALPPAQLTVPSLPAAQEKLAPMATRDGAGSPSARPILIVGIV
jgi:hypothetical protein